MYSERERRIEQLQRKLKDAGSNVDTIRVLRLESTYGKQVVITEVTKKNAKGELVL